MDLDTARLVNVGDSLEDGTWASEQHHGATSWPGPRMRLSARFKVVLSSTAVLAAGAVLALCVAGRGATGWVAHSDDLGATTELNMAREHPYFISLTRDPVAGLGIDVRDVNGVIRIEHVGPEGAVATWNAAHPDKFVESGDTITQVNSARGSAKEMLEQLQEPSTDLVKIQPKTSLHMDSRDEGKARSEATCFDMGGEFCCLGVLGYYCAATEGEARPQAER